MVGEPPISPKKEEVFGNTQIEDFKGKLRPQEKGPRREFFQLKLRVI